MIPTILGLGRGLAGVIDILLMAYQKLRLARIRKYLDVSPLDHHHAKR